MCFSMVMRGVFRYIFCPCVMICMHDLSKSIDFTVNLNLIKHYNLKSKNNSALPTRSGVKDTRLEAKVKNRIKNPRPQSKTVLPRTIPLKAKHSTAHFCRRSLEVQLTSWLLQISEFVVNCFLFSFSRLIRKVCW